MTIHQYFLRSFVFLVSIIALGIKPPIATAQTEQKSLNILTWNIYMLPSIVPLPNRSKRAEKIIDTLNKSDFDIVVFQEAFHKKTQQKLANELGQKFPFMYGPFNPPSNGFKTNSGVWIVSKIELSVLGSIVFEARSGIDKMAEKGAALLSGNLNGNKFQLLGTHMQSDYKPKIRTKQFEQMNAELLHKHREEGVPQIICGDLNTEWVYENDYKEMLVQLDAKDGEIISTQKETYDGFTNEIVAKSWGKRKTNFDYILIKRNGAKFKSEKRWVSVIKKRWSKRSTDLSDHYGLACELIF